MLIEEFSEKWEEEKLKATVIDISWHSFLAIKDRRKMT